MSPLRAVLDAMAGGARSRAELAERTGLRPDVVDAAIEHLSRTGHIDARELTVGCPSGGCGTCASGDGGRPACGAAAPDPARTGRALVELTVRRP